MTQKFMETRDTHIQQIKDTGLLHHFDDLDTNDNIGQFETFLKSHPENYIGFFLLGVLYQKVNRFQNAVESYNAALKNNPDYFHAMHNLSVIHRIMGDIDSSHQLLQKCLKINPNSPHAWHNLGILYIFKEEVHLIEEVINKLKTLNQSYADSLIQIKNEYNESNRY